MRIVVLLVVLAAVAGGCGSSGPGYAQRMHNVLAPSGSRILKLRVAIGRVQSTQEGVLVLGRLRSTERAVRTKVGAIAPPAKAAGAHRRLLGALDRLDAQVQRLMVVARKGQLAPFVTAAQRFGSSSVFAQLGRALDAIEAAGYPLHLSS